MTVPPMRARRGAAADRLLLLLAAALCAVLAWELIGRLSYRCDLLIWSESPVMTNLMKIAAGEPVFGDWRELNSFVYSPGLEWLAWAVLSPFGLALDVRACRCLVVLIGLGAAACVTAFCGAALRTLIPPESRAAPAGCTFLTAFLVLCHNLSADTVHPDNLHVLHATLTLALVVYALGSERLAPSLFAAAFAGLGILVKQTAVLAPLGATLALVLGQPRPRSAQLRIVLAAACVGGTATAALLIPEWPRYYLFTLLSRHEIHPSKILPMLSVWLTGPPLLLAIAVPAAIHELHTRGGSRGRQLLWAWGCVGLFEVLPSIAGFLKVMGAANNLGILTLWLFVIVWPVLIRCTDSSDGTAQPVGLRRALACGVILSCFPLRLPPSPQAVASCDAFIAMVAQDRRDGKSVLVGHGTSALLFVGDRRVPRFRTNSYLELEFAGATAELGALDDAIAAADFDRTYLFRGTSMASSGPFIARYEKVATLPAQRPLVKLEKLLNPIFEGAPIGFPMYGYALDIYEPRNAVRRSRR